MFVLGVIGTSVVVLTAVWAVMKNLFIPRTEIQKLMSELNKQHEECLARLEDRHEKKLHEFEQMINRLHEDNVEARHRLRDNLNTPLLQLSVAVAKNTNAVVSSKAEIIKAIREAGNATQ